MIAIASESSSQRAARLAVAGVIAAWDGVGWRGFRGFGDAITTVAGLD